MKHSCTDHIFVKNNNLINKFEAGVVQITDYFSTILAIPINAKLKAPNKYMIEIINFTKLNTKLESELWIDLHHNNDVNKCCGIFYDKINKAINLITEIRNWGSKYKIKEWMTTGLLVSARRKQYFYIKTKKHPNNKTLYLYYINYKNNFTKILRLAKINFYKNKFNRVASNPKLT